MPTLLVDTCAGAGGAQTRRASVSQAPADRSSLNPPRSPHARHLRSSPSTHLDVAAQFLEGSGHVSGGLAHNGARLLHALARRLHRQLNRGDIRGHLHGGSANHGDGAVGVALRAGGVGAGRVCGEPAARARWLAEGGSRSAAAAAAAAGVHFRHSAARLSRSGGDRATRWGGRGRLQAPCCTRLRNPDTLPLARLRKRAACHEAQQQQGGHTHVGRSLRGWRGQRGSGLCRCWGSAHCSGSLQALRKFVGRQE